MGGREIGYMFGQYKRLRNEFTGVLTGKKPAWGGSLIRPEATGYGATYFMAEMLATQRGVHRRQDRGHQRFWKRGVARGRESACASAAKVMALSDSKGSIHDPAGFTEEKLAWLKDLKEVRRGRIRNMPTPTMG